MTLATRWKNLWTPRPDLTRWQHAEPTSAAGEQATWTVDFRQMKCFLRRDDRARQVTLADDAYHLRRAAPDGWAIKLLDEYFQLLVEQLTVTAADPAHPDSALAQQRLEQLGEGPAWEAVDEGVQPPLEQAYQRFRAG